MSYQHIYGNSMLNKVTFSYFLSHVCTNVGSVYITAVVQWNVHVHHDRHICLGAYANNVKLIYSSIPGHIVDFIEFI